MLILLGIRQSEFQIIPSIHLSLIPSQASKNVIEVSYFKTSSFFAFLTEAVDVVNKFISLIPFGISGIENINDCIARCIICYLDTADMALLHCSLKWSAKQEPVFTPDFEQESNAVPILVAQLSVHELSQCCSDICILV